MAAAVQDFTIEQGATWLVDLIWAQDTSPNPTPINNTGYTGKMQFRRTINDATVLLELTQAFGLVFGGTNGKITIFLTAVLTSAITWYKAVYDLEVTSPGAITTRLLKGNIAVDRQVTR